MSDFQPTTPSSSQRRSTYINALISTGIASSKTRHDHIERRLRKAEIIRPVRYDYGPCSFVEKATATMVALAGADRVEDAVPAFRRLWHLSPSSFSDLARTARYHNPSVPAVLQSVGWAVRAWLLGQLRVERAVFYRHVDLAEFTAYDEEVEEHWIYKYGSVDAPVAGETFEIHDKAMETVASALGFHREATS